MLTQRVGLATYVLIRATSCLIPRWLSKELQALPAGIRSHKPQASSFKHQASSFRTNPFNRQAASIPTRVTSVKLQAISYKLFYPRTMVHGYWRSFRGQRTKGLCKYKSVVWVFNMEAKLVWRKSKFVTFSNL